MSILPGWSQVLDFFGTPMVIAPSPGQLSGDAGLLPVGQGRCASEAGPGRYSATGGLDAPGRLPCGGGV
jgi:hypothetical protein